MAIDTATTTIKGIDATYYMTKDLAAATAFYDRLLDMKPAATAPGAFAEYTFADGNAFGLYQSSTFYAGGTVMFAVDDVAEFVSAAQAHGLSCFGDGRVEDTPSCYMAFGTDPEGNQFMIHKRK